MFNPCIAHHIKLNEIKRLEEIQGAFFLVVWVLCPKSILNIPNALWCAE
jgi:hypothetical protein